MCSSPASADGDQTGDGQADAQQHPARRLGNHGAHQHALELVQLQVRDVGHRRAAVHEQRQVAGEGDRVAAGNQGTRDLVGQRAGFALSPVIGDVLARLALGRDALFSLWRDLCLDRPSLAGS